MIYFFHEENLFPFNEQNLVLDDFRNGYRTGDRIASLKYRLKKKLKDGSKTIPVLLPVFIQLPPLLTRSGLRTDFSPPRMFLTTDVETKTARALEKIDERIFSLIQDKYEKKISNEEATGFFRKSPFSCDNGSLKVKLKVYGKDVMTTIGHRNKETSEELFIDSESTVSCLACFQDIYYADGKFFSRAFAHRLIVEEKKKRDEDFSMI